MSPVAGNAMTSTIVGTTILAAVLLGREYLSGYAAAPVTTGSDGGLVTSTGVSEGGHGTATPAGLVLRLQFVK